MPAVMLCLSTINDDKQCLPSSRRNALFGIILEVFAEYGDAADLLGIQQHVETIIKAYATEGNYGGTKTRCHAHKFGLLGPEELILLTPHLVSLHTISLVSKRFGILLAGLSRTASSQNLGCTAQCARHRQTMLWRT